VEQCKTLERDAIAVEHGRECIGGEKGKGRYYEIWEELYIESMI
jgi:hypothetical protein